MIIKTVYTNARQWSPQWKLEYLLPLMAWLKRSQNINGINENLIWDFISKLLQSTAKTVSTDLSGAFSLINLLISKSKRFINRLAKPSFIKGGKRICTTSCELSMIANNSSALCWKKIIIKIKKKNKKERKKVRQQ